MTQETPQNFKIIFTSIITFPACVVVSIFVYSLFNNIPFLEAMDNFLLQTFTTLYRQHHNIIPAPEIIKINFYRFIYSALLLNIAIVLVARIIVKNNISQTKRPLISLIFSPLFTAYIFMISIQLVGLSAHFNQEYKRFSHKSTEQKYSEILKSIYTLPQKTKEFFPGYHRATLITDLDLTKDPGQLYSRQLAYFLYPIDIRGIHKYANPDLALIFFKNNAIQYVPKDYLPYHIFDSENLIAVKP